MSRLAVGLGFVVLGGAVLGIGGAAVAQTATIDGFTITSLTPPATPVVPVATRTSLNTFSQHLGIGNVLYLTSSSAVGASPYAGALAGHAAFLSIQGDGHAAFTFPVLATTLFLNWGSVGSADELDFYSGATEVGILTGSDVAAVFGAAKTIYVSIGSPVAFNQVVLKEGANCCFEFSNLSAQ